MVRSFVLDTSILLQVARGEPGADAMLPRLREGIISVVNLAEAMNVLVRKGTPRSVAEAAIRPLVYKLVPFGDEEACDVGKVREIAGAADFSLGDCACLATARLRGSTVLTNDKLWLEYDFGVRIELGRKPRSKAG